MIEQQLGFSLESFLRGIVGISTVLGVAYLMSYLEELVTHVYVDDELELV